MSPDTSAPTTVPSSTGAIVLAIENTRPKRRWPGSPDISSERNANAEPRSTTPTTNSVSGTCSATEIAANAGGKPLNSTTITRINQTWFASHTGPIAAAIARRCAAARGPLASRSQTPPPKSAPPNRK